MAARPKSLPRRWPRRASRRCTLKTLLAHCRVLCWWDSVMPLRLSGHVTRLVQVFLLARSKSAQQTWSLCRMSAGICGEWRIWGLDFLKVADKGVINGKLGLFLRLDLCHVASSRPSGFQHPKHSTAQMAGVLKKPACCALTTAQS